MTQEQRHDISDLLQRLNSPEAGAAWVDFVNRFAHLIMKTASQFEYRQDRSSACFLYVCEKLCDQQFRRLQKYNATGSAKFHHWLSTVVFNLCVDWHRKEFGRAVVLPAIAALPAFDQLVYRYSYEMGMGQDACYQAIKPDFPELTAPFAEATIRLNRLLFGSRLNASSPFTLFLDAIRTG